MPKALNKRHRVKAANIQNLTRRDKEGVATMPVEQFDRRVAHARQPKSLVQFFRESPLVEVELELERDNDNGRDIEL